MDIKNIFNDLNLKLLKGEIIGLIDKQDQAKQRYRPSVRFVTFIKRTNLTRSERTHIENKLQNIIGYVPQDVHLLNDSLKKNIAFGLEENEIDQHKLNKAIIASQLKTLNNLGKSGVDTMVGERGNLSEDKFKE